MFVVMFHVQCLRKPNSLFCFQEEEEEEAPKREQVSFTVRMLSFQADKKVQLIKEIKNLMEGLNLVQVQFICLDNLCFIHFIVSRFGTYRTALCLDNLCQLLLGHFIHCIVRCFGTDSVTPHHSLYSEFGTDHTALSCFFGLVVMCEFLPLYICWEVKMSDVIMPTQPIEC